MLVTDNRTVAAGATVENILSGTSLERAPRASTYTVYAVQDTGTGTVVADIFVGTEEIALGAELPKVAAGTGPNRNEHEFIPGVDMIVASGQLVRIKLRETGGTTATPTRLQVVSKSIAALAAA